MLQYAKGDWLAALKTSEQALEIDRAVWGADSSELAIGLNNVGHMRMQLGDYTRAVADLNESVARTERADGVDSARAAVRRCGLGVALAMTGRLEEGIDRCERSVSILGDAGLSQRAELINALQKLGQLRLWRGDFALALGHFERALRVGDTLGTEWPERQRWVARIGRAESELALDRADRALSELREAGQALSADNATVSSRLSAALALAEYARRHDDLAAARANWSYARELAAALPAVRPYDAHRLETLAQALDAAAR
jgi:tetratricopeptide (TPR) repeat protein